LPRLLEWLHEASPDVACLQELKTDDSKFPIQAIQDAGYGALWHGQRSYHGVAILAKGETPRELRRGLPEEPADKHTRYLEAEARGIVVASVYLPNGNPVPSPNFDYKLRWFERFIRHAEELSSSARPVVLAGDLNVIPTDFDVYNPGGDSMPSCSRPRAMRFAGYWRKAGWTARASCIRKSGCTPTG